MSSASIPRMERTSPSKVKSAPCSLEGFLALLISRTYSIQTAARSDVHQVACTGAGQPINAEDTRQTRFAGVSRVVPSLFRDQGPRRSVATASIVDGALPSRRLFTNRNAGVRDALAASASVRRASRVAGLGSWTLR